MARLVGLGLFVALAFGLLGLLAFGLARQGISATLVPVRPRPAPNFSLTLFDGGRFDLSSQRGKVVVVNFWASWCVPCRTEAPVLEAIWQRYRDQGVIVVGVNIWDSEASARAYIREFGLTFPNGPDPTGAVVVDYGVTGIPETYLISPDGTIRRKWNGPITEASLVTLIEGLRR